MRLVFQTGTLDGCRELRGGRSSWFGSRDSRSRLDLEVGDVVGAQGRGDGERRRLRLVRDRLGRSLQGVIDRLTFPLFRFGCRFAGLDWTR